MHSLGNVAVLVVDDSATLRRLVRVVLESADAVVCEAVDDDEAWMLAASRDFDVAIVDLELGAVSGLAFVSRLRACADERLRTLPVLVLSAHSDKACAEQARATGVQAFMTKPFRVAAFLEEVSARARRRPSGRGASA